MPKDIAIVGIGETPPTRRSDKDVRGLAVDAVLAALEDAGIEPGEVDGFVTDGTVMPPTVPHEWMAGQLRVPRRFDASLSYAGAGTVAAPMLARMAIHSGLAKVVVCYFSVDWGTRPGGPYAFHDAFPAKPAFEKPYGFNAQPLYFSMIAQRYREVYGLRDEHLGALAIQQRRNAILTGRAQNMKPMDLDAYLAEPMVAEPLRRADCCLISDGAAAFVMTSAERARDCRKAPIWVKGVSLGADGFTGDDVFTQKPDILSLPSFGIVREQVEREAGCTIAEADFAELYDCFSMSCLMQIEDLGFCAKGEAGDFVLEGHTRLDGKLPVNTHGGLLSYSYRLAVEHVTEAVRQLRGEAGAVQVKDARLGIVTALSNPDVALLMLGRD